LTIFSPTTLVNGNLRQKTLITQTEGYDGSYVESTNQFETEIRLFIHNITNYFTVYSYNSSGVLIYFFVAFDSEGNVHAAFDACDVCYSESKGYKCTERMIICNNCGNEFLISSIGTENLSGGCWPTYLPIRIEGDYIVINKSDLDKKQYMFQQPRSTTTATTSTATTTTTTTPELSSGFTGFVIIVSILSLLILKRRENYLIR
jgi:hypothetical protein